MKLCLTIGVSSADKLSALPGAITVADEMGKWALLAGYKTEVVTDKSKPVTIERIKKALENLLSEKKEIEHLILHFAGHGVRTDIEQNGWLPSNWFSADRIISVEGLRKKLYRYGIKSISIFNDACRSLPSNLDVANLTPDPILGRGPEGDSAPIIDRFNAVTDGREAFMLYGDDVGPARCVFSTVLIEGLSGRFTTSFASDMNDCILPDSLADYAKQRLQQIGIQYNLRCTPELFPGYPREHVIFYRQHQNAKKIPMPIWPSPRLNQQGVVVPPANLQKNNPVQTPKTVDKNLNVENTIGFALNAQRTKQLNAQLKGDLKRIRQQVRDAASNFELSNLQNRFDITALQNNLSDHITDLHEDTNLVVLGKKPIRVWADSKSKALSDQIEYVTEFHVETLPRDSTQILVEFADNIVGSAVVYDELLTIVLRDESEVKGWACIKKGMVQSLDVNKALEIVAELRNGNISVNDLEKVAVSLRESKHLNPTLGAVASYLYDYMGDLDNIRRMAYFYSDSRQAIPFDIAFMGLLQTISFGQPDFSAVVPKVQASEVTPANKNYPNWVRKETEEVTARVAGYWPWLRQGWQFVDDPQGAEEIPAVTLHEVTEHLLKSAFTSFDSKGLEILKLKFNLEGNV